MAMFLITYVSFTFVGITLVKKKHPYSLFCWRSEDNEQIGHRPCSRNEPAIFILGTQFQ